MKKIMVAITLMAFIVQLAGCGLKSDKPTPAECSGVDSRKGTEAYNQCKKELSNRGFFETQVTCLILGTMAGSLASDECKKNIEEKKSTLEPQQRMLPNNYILAQNKYEEFGIAHNKWLIFLEDDGGWATVSQKLINYDIATYKKVFENFPNNDYYVNNADAIVDEYRNSNLATVFQNAVNNDYDGMTSVELNQYFNEINNSISQMKIANSTIDELISFINTKIVGVYSSADGEQLSENEINKLIYLSIYKHSLYYWYKWDSSFQ